MDDDSMRFLEPVSETGTISSYLNNINIISQWVPARGKRSLQAYAVLLDLAEIC